VALVVSGCGTSAARPAEKKRPDVVVTTPVSSEVADYEDFTGRLDAIKTVDIRARVSGFLLKAPFKEGDFVREGQELFLIDPQSYRADFNVADANHKLAQADRSLQEKNTARARTMIAGRAMAEEDFDTTLAALVKSHATVEAMAATRDRTKLYLDWTRVTAPLSGRISRRYVDPGNLIVADNTLLTTIVNDKQLYAYFDVDERTYLELVPPGSTDRHEALTKQQFPVLLRLANEEEFTRTGVVDFVDNRVTATTGTIRMRAIFENPTGSLRSGLFARIRLPVGAPYQALIIPDEAVSSDQGRKYVYVVDDKNEIAYRPVTVGQEIKDLRVIKDGISKGDRVVISGMQRVRAGTLVNFTVQEPPKPPESPLATLLKSQQQPPAQGERPGK
jgi:RND family efflux transporter MFP subunit